MRQLWPRFGLAWKPDPIHVESVFDRGGPIVLEIGFGNGESLAEMAENRPDENFIGIDVHRPGIGHLLLEIERRSLTNTRVICGDAVPFMNECIADGALSRIQLFFPDPWPKRRHHKRRIVQSEWVSLAARKLEPDGVLHMATDWEDYAKHMLRVTGSDPLLENLAANQFVGRLNDRPVTRYEQRGRRLGHSMWDIGFRRNQVTP